MKTKENYRGKHPEKSKNPIEMAKAMKYAVIAGRKSFLSGRMKTNFLGSASSPKKGVI